MKRASAHGEHFYRHGRYSGYAEHRYGSAQPISRAGGKQERPIYSAGKRQHLISRVVEEMADWRLSPFEKEGAFRAALRSMFCLEGHPWRQADAEAMFIVGQALKAAGVPRPSWAEGQPDYLDSPDRCSWCAGPVDGIGKSKVSRYCSVVCAKSALESRDFCRRSEADRAYAAAARVVKKSRTTARTCEECRSPFHPPREKSSQRFCSFSCGAKGGMKTKPRWGFASVAVTMACAFCGSEFKAQHRKEINCSRVCINAWDGLRKGKEPKRLRANVFDRYITSKVEPAILSPSRLDFLMWQSGCIITGEASVPRVTDGLFALT